MSNQYKLHTGDNQSYFNRQFDADQNNPFVTNYPKGYPEDQMNDNNKNNPNQKELNPVEKVMGKKGTLQDGVLKFTFPRYDLNVNVGWVSIQPEFALTTWMAFDQSVNYTMVMGDMVLIESEIEPVISQLILSGIEITAIHNHLLYEFPRVMYMHISGVGNALDLAQSVKNALSVTNTPLESYPAGPALPQDYWNSVETIMGKKGSRVGRVIQFSYPRADTIKEFGVELPPSMGISQAVNFQAEEDFAATTGDFVLIAEEVNKVIRVLTQYGISVTAVHNHMLYDNPHLFFLHFWAVGFPERLAYGLRQALGQTNSVIG